MNNILIKPVIDADKTTRTESYPDWILFEAGNLGKPMAILTDLQLEAICKEYMKYHDYKLISFDKSEKEI